MINTKTKKDLGKNIIKRKRDQDQGVKRKHQRSINITKGVGLDKQIIEEEIPQKSIEVRINNPFIKGAIIIYSLANYLTIVKIWVISKMDSKMKMEIKRIV